MDFPLTLASHVEVQVFLLYGSMRQISVLTYPLIFYYPWDLATSYTH